MRWPNQSRETKFSGANGDRAKFQFPCLGNLEQDLQPSMVITLSRVWINRARLPILLVVSWTGKMNISLSPFAPENLVSRDGFGRPVPRPPVPSPHPDWIWCLLTGFLPTSAAASIYSFKPPCAVGWVPNLSGHTIAYRWRSLPRAR